MMKSWFLPAFMGAAMAPMMLWMLHDEIMAANGTGLSLKLLSFALAHLVVIATLAGLAAFGLRRRIHVPSLRHFVTMIGSAACVAGAIHLTMHWGTF